MKVYVKTGPSGPIVPIELEDDATVLATKTSLEWHTGIKPEKQILKFKGKKLDDDAATLESCGVQKDFSLRNQSLEVSDH